MRARRTELDRRERELSDQWAMLQSAQVELMRERERFSADKKEQSKDGSGSKQDAKKTDGDKAGDDKPFDTVVKDMEVVKGLFTFYRKDDENKLLLEILPDQLEKTFLFASSTDHAEPSRSGRLRSRPPPSVAPWSRPPCPIRNMRNPFNPELRSASS